jgi:cytochrome oxidase Cu insertion factor (SCO1/SenC/PrrC family)
MMTGGNMKFMRLSLALLFAASCVLGEERQLGPKDGFDLPPSDLERVHVGLSAPDFTLESKDNELVTLSSFRGKNNVVLVFYRGYW